MAVYRLFTDRLKYEKLIYQLPSFAARRPIPVVINGAAIAQSFDWMAM